MTKNETNKLISSLIKEIKIQNKIILDSVQCESMTEEQLHYFKQGLKFGLMTAIDILKEEKLYKEEIL